jgi:hypothetical protein
MRGLYVAVVAIRYEHHHKRFTIMRVEGELSPRHQRNCMYPLKVIKQSTKLRRIRNRKMVFPKCRLRTRKRVEWTRMIPQRYGTLVL